MDLLEKLKAAEELLIQAQDKLKDLGGVDIHQARLRQVIEGTESEMRLLREKKVELLKQLASLADMASRKSWSWIEFQQFIKNANGSSIKFYVYPAREVVCQDGKDYSYSDFVSQGLMPAGGGDYIGFYWICKQMFKLVESYLTAVPRQHRDDLGEMEKLLTALAEGASSALRKCE
jgi:hypothetical protein